MQDQGLYSPAAISCWSESSELSVLTIFFHRVLMLRTSMTKKLLMMTRSSRMMKKKGDSKSRGSARELRLVHLIWILPQKQQASATRRTREKGIEDKQRGVSPKALTLATCNLLL